MIRFGIPLGLIFLYLVYGLYLVQHDIRVVPDDLVAEPPRGFFDYRGITNINGDDLSKIIEAAQDVGLDFLSITELNQFDKTNPMAGYHGSLLVMMDGEYSYLNSRLLNIGATSNRHLQGLGRSQVLFADLLSQTKRDKDLGLFVLAHPNKPKYAWAGEIPDGMDGLELINLKEVWRQASDHKRWSFGLSLLQIPFHEKLALLRLFDEPIDEVRLWDSLSSRRPISAFAGAGAAGQLRYPTYRTLLSLVRNHVLLRSELLGQASGDIDKLASALRKGQFYLSLDILGDPKGFNAMVIDGKGSRFTMGSQLPWQQGMYLEVLLARRPKVPFDVIIYRNGEKIMTSNATTTKLFLQEPGTYRVMVRVIPTFPLPDGKRWIPWIYSNPFYVSPRVL